MVGSGSPNYPDLFKTSTGFWLIYNKNDNQIYVKTYDNNCNVISDDKKINILQNYSVQSDAQKIGIEVDCGYFIVWDGPTIPASKSHIYRQGVNRYLWDQ